MEVLYENIFLLIKQKKRIFKWNRDRNSKQKKLEKGTDILSFGKDRVKTRTFRDLIMESEEQ